MNITPNIHTYLTSAPSSHFLNREVEILAHWAGHDNLLWRVRSGSQEAVLKLYLDAGQARSRRQYDGQQLFAPFGLAPRPIWTDRYPEGLSRQVLIYEWAPGETLDPANPAQMAALARSVAQVHGSDSSEVRRFSPNPINLDYFWRILRGSIAPIQGWLAEQQAATFAIIFTQLADHAGALVEAGQPLWASTLPTPVHGDLKLENGIDSFGAAILLDWEMFGLGDPALEVANFLYLSQQALDESMQSEWLETYLSVFDQPALIQRIGVYQRLLPFQATCFLLDGLRQYLASKESKTTEIVESLPFLKTTLNATLQQTSAALQCELINPEDAVQTLFSF